MALAEGIAVQSAFDLFLEQNLNKELLRFTTAGSVDDGKSTLIGRLLHDSKSVYEDQLASVKKSRINRANGPIDFSLLTDGLRAEREQGITIDVGYRYFQTSRRKFIIADTPGHEQYTRNMATGASTADLAVILIDGTKGLLPQTLRHTYIAFLLGIPRVVSAVNKMDLLRDQRENFLALEKEFVALAGRLGISEVQCIPISALAGDNVVERSTEMTWYEGPTLLEHLETVPISKPSSASAFRFPVQYVIRPNGSFRGFAGQIANGMIRPGDPVVALPSGQQTRVQSIVSYDGLLPNGFLGMSVNLKLTDEIDVSRGDMLVSPGDQPEVSRRFCADIVWLHAEPLQIERTYLLKQTTRQVRGKVTAIRHRVKMSTLEPEPAEQLQMNDIATIEVEAHTPLLFDSYQQNRTTGSFIVIDPSTNATIGAGMIREALIDNTTRIPVSSTHPVTPHERHQRHGHMPAIVLVGARPKLALRLERALFDSGFQTVFTASEKAPSASDRTAWEALYAAGFVVLYQNSLVRPEQKAELRAAIGHRFFDLEELDLPHDEEDAIAKVLTLLRRLRLVGGAQNSPEVI